MFNLSYMTPSELAGEIKVNKMHYSLGNFTDAEGKRWNIRAVINDILLACPIESLHPYYSDTSGASYGLVSQQWLPYKQVVQDTNKETS